jgi:DNA-binding GntR family transcriptional regulator
MRERQKVGRVTHRGVASEAAALIQRAIFDGEFEPGAALLEVDLADSMGISRGSVREGLAQLEREGLVVTAWHRPSRVIDVTRKDAIDLYQLRTALDGLAATGAAQAPNQDSLEDAMRDLEAASRSNAELRELLRLDLCFHDAIYHLAGNPRLQQAWNSIRSQVQLFQTRRVLTDIDDYRQRLLSEHRDIVNLIARGPSEELDVYIRAHITSALEALLKGLDE